MLFLKVLRIEVGAGTHIWSGNLFKSLRGLHVGEHCTMMRFNRATAIPAFRRVSDADPELVGVLWLGDHVLITKGHALDCSGGVVMESWSAIAGRETLVYSHSYDPSQHELTCAVTRICETSMIAARTTLASGSTLPKGSILAMGSTLMPGKSKEYCLYAGMPARAVREVTDWAFLGHRDMARPPIRK
ncbi:MAG: hypothetical protein H0T85_07245 [Geodermatophilaceae bacterium]|nr:hypothetical protein [Geodermatophilaceae bacterium]